MFEYSRCLPWIEDADIPAVQGVKNLFISIENCQDTKV